MRKISVKQTQKQNNKNKQTHQDIFRIISLKYIPRIPKMINKREQRPERNSLTYNNLQNQGEGKNYGVKYVVMTD